MKTEFVKLTGAVQDAAIYKRAGEIIMSGGLVAFPTETVYGLGGDAKNEVSSEKIYAAKGRPSDNPLIVHIAALEDLSAIVKDIPPKAVTLAEKFWPGPLTMIFNKNEVIPYSTTGGLETVAVRMPQHELALNFIKNAGGYIAAPSANLSGRPSPTTAGHVLDDLDGRIDMILDGGSVGIGVESTIVDMTGDVPMLLRPGYISLSMLREAVGEVLVDPAITGTLPDGTHPKAPGMKYKHYAPKGELFIVKGKDIQTVSSKINELADSMEAQGKKAAIIATEESCGLYHGNIVKCIGSRQDEETIARNLFAVLRELDDIGADYIYSEELDTPLLGMAVMNRLIKAAGHKVVDAD